MFVLHLTSYHEQARHCEYDQPVVKENHPHKSVVTHNNEPTKDENQEGRVASKQDSNNGKEVSPVNVRKGPCRGM